MHKIIRVFPTRTTATPDDPLAYYDVPDMFVPEVSEVHISVAFTWDREYAEFLAHQWKSIAPVKIGGPGYTDDPGGDFEPGMYMRNGYVITSRGCPNKCWFCSVWKRESGIRELPIRDGYIVQDDNLLACSDQHINQVFEMLNRQNQKAQLMGLEAKLLRSWHVNLIASLKPKPRALWFAYDTPDDLEPLVNAGRLLKDAGYNQNTLYCYVLVGHPKDTMNAATERLHRVWKEGFMPFAMLWRNEKGYRDPIWVKFSWPWKRPAAARSMCMKENNEARLHRATNA